MPPPLSSDALLALPGYRNTLASLSPGSLPPLPALPQELLDQARTHTSYYGFPSDGFYVSSSLSPASPDVAGSVATGGPEMRSDFERFEFLGDAILSSSLALMIYNQYPDLSEGVMSSLKGALQANRTLHAISHAYGLQGNMRVHGSAMAMKLNQDHPVVAKLFEALIAAIYLAHGMDETISFIQGIYRPHLLPSAHALLVQHNAQLLAQLHQSDVDPSSRSFINYIGKLQEWSTKHGERVEYRMLASEGGKKGEKLVHRGEIWVGGVKTAEEKADTVKGVRHMLAKKALELIETAP